MTAPWEANGQPVPSAGQDQVAQLRAQLAEVRLTAWRLAG